MNTKRCLVCGCEYVRPKGESEKNWARRQTCSKACMGQRKAMMMRKRRDASYAFLDPVDLDDR